MRTAEVFATLGHQPRELGQGTYPPVLVISGSMGVGKTTVLGEAPDRERFLEQRLVIDAS